MNRWQKINIKAVHKIYKMGVIRLLLVDWSMAAIEWARSRRRKYRRHSYHMIPRTGGTFWYHLKWCLFQLLEPPIDSTLETHPKIKLK